MKSIYLIKSDSYQLLNTELSKITDGIETISNFSLSDSSIIDVIDDAGYFGLFDENRAIIVRDVKYFGGKFLYEEDTEKLYKFLNNINDITIAFICDEISEKKAITEKMIQLGAKIIIINSKDNMDTIINNYLKEQEIELDSALIPRLMENSFNDLDIFLQEINRLSIIDKHITKEIVEKYSISKSDEDVTFEFSNAVTDKNFTKAFELLDRLLESGVEVASLIGLLASSFENIYMVKDAVSHGLTDDEIAKALEYKNPKRVFVMKKTGNKYDLDTLKNIIIKLSEIDIRIKTGYNPEYEIKEFLLNL